jgi:hypothetical protein
VSTDILHVQWRVLAIRELSHGSGLPANVFDDLSAGRGRPIIIPMTTTGRHQRRYDHRLQDLVQRTRDVTIATDLGIPRSTARGWLAKALKSVVSLDMTNVNAVELRKKSWRSADA